MKHTNRSFLIALVLLLLLACGIGVSRPVRDRIISADDCAGQCKDRYNEMLKGCDALPGERAGKCQAAAQKQYDSCLERCRGQNISNPGRP